MTHTIAISGSTGFVGRELVAQLLAAGHNVRALVRDTAKAREVLPSNARLAVVQGHVHDGVAASKLVDGADVCINLIGILRQNHAGPFGGQTFQRMHVDATQVLLDACKAAAKPVTRFIQMSALGVTVDGRAEYQRTKARAEQLVRHSGLDWTIFRPGLIHGLGGEFTGMLKGWCRGSIAPFFFVPYFTRLVEHDDGAILGRVSFESARIAPVGVRDVAAAFVASIDRAESVGEIYNVVGAEELTWPQMLRTFNENLAQPGGLPIVGVPAEPHIYMAKAAGAIGLGGLLPFDDGMPAMAQEDATADLTKLKAHLGVHPSGFRALVAQYAGSLA